MHLLPCRASTKVDKVICDSLAPLPSPALPCLAMSCCARSIRSLYFGTRRRAYDAASPSPAPPVPAPAAASAPAGAAPAPARALAPPAPGRLAATPPSPPASPSPTPSPSSASAPPTPLGPQERVAKRRVVQPKTRAGGVALAGHGGVVGRRGEHVCQVKPVGRGGGPGGDARVVVRAQRGRQACERVFALCCHGGWRRGFGRVRRCCSRRGALGGCCALCGPRR